MKPKRKTTSVGEAMFKFIMIGDSATGKSSLLTRYIKDQFNQEYSVTVGVQFGSKMVTVNQNYRVKLQIWDTAGQESFRSIVKSFYRNSAAVILVFNITNTSKFDAGKKASDHLMDGSYRPNKTPLKMLFSFLWELIQTQNQSDKLKNNKLKSGYKKMMQKCTFRHLRNLHQTLVRRLIKLRRNCFWGNCQKRGQAHLRARVNRTQFDYKHRTLKSKLILSVAERTIIFFDFVYFNFQLHKVICEFIQQFIIFLQHILFKLLYLIRYLPMNQKYDAIVCGTGLVECILSGLLSQEGKKVLHIDRNPFYGGEGASVNLTNLWKLFKDGKEPPKQLGHNRDWNIDLIPKYIMSGGKLVKILLKTRVSKYLEWKAIDGTYVLQNKQAGFFSKGGLKIAKVPVTPKQALSSDLMGMLEKRRCQKFMEAMQNYQEGNPKTYDGIQANKPAKVMFEKFGLQQNTIDFIGHAVALYADQKFMNYKGIDVIRKIQLYMDSMGRYGNSPFIYPIYGLGGIPEGFSRISAVNGGTFMLNTDINQVLFQDGKVIGVKGPQGVANAPLVICDPTYALKCGLNERVKFVQKVIRCICILDHPIKGTENIPSVQIIIPQRQIKRQNDIYIMMVSSVHCVSKKDTYIAIISTTVQTEKPEQQIEVALELIGPVRQKFVKISERYISCQTVKNDGLFVSTSFDATSHFENETQNVLAMYKAITGKDLDLENLPNDEEE